MKKLVYLQIHWVPLPTQILQFHKDVTLEWYLLFINGMNFINSQIRKIKFRSIERTKYRGNKTIIQGLRSVIYQYQTKVLKFTGHRDYN